ncbi:MAG: CCA tRNA nucleotidyltransferase [Acidimicrobiales bacterium]|nr:CCA tRNA nucleotidyltransferase [Acidimicrobiales bacterium]MCB9392969.1 CCA tRNA nucleotidyltransferase [Acidimicrobiaceae bacterium]
MAGGVSPAFDPRTSPRLEVMMRELRPLAERFAAAGHRLYLVGGSVRDLVIGDDRPEVDLDATTTAHPSEIKRLLHGWADAIWTQGERFGTIGAMKRAGEPPAERIFEITTHRAEAYRGDSRKPDVAFSDDVEADLSRRDFTVNAMAIELTSPTPRLVDPFGGAADLAAKVLRTPLAPSESFADDPLRMLRAARFVTRYDLVPVPALVQAVREMGGRVEIVSAERIRDELDKLVVTPSPSTGWSFVLDTGLADHVVPEVAAVARAAAVGATPGHRVVAEVPASCRLARWAAVFSGVPSAAVASRLRALRASTADVDMITLLVDVHQRWFIEPAADAGWTDGEVRRLVLAASPRHHQLLDELLALAEATARAGDDDARRARLSTLRERVAHLASREDLGSLRPELSGAEVMRALGVGPGRDVGAALAFLLDLRLEEGLVGAAAATRRLSDWWTTTRAADVASADISIDT